MQRPRPARSHPLLSPLALLGALLLLAALAFVVYRSGGQAFSPGPLSAVSATNQNAGGASSHASFGDDCTACHTPLQGIAPQKCTACHTTIARQQATGEGLHGRLTDPTCTACHSEHEGADVDLLAQSLESFSQENHALFFPLEGAHGELECAACHTNNQFAGTPTTCAGCHAEPDVHRGQFGTTCATCHTTATWEEAGLRVHAFPLDHGGLGTLPCVACHNDTYATFICTACHEAGFEARRDEVLNP